MSYLVFLDQSSLE